MARVLLCWEMGNGLAYIEGLKAGGQVIADAGHEVVYAVRDLAHAERVLGTERYFQAPTTVIPPHARVSNPMTFADVLMNLGFGQGSGVAGRLHAWRNLFRQLRPDIIRCSNSPGALLAARGTSIRTVAIGTGFLVPPSVSPLPMLRPWAKEYSMARIASREQEVLSAMNQGLDAIGAPRLDSVSALYAEVDVRQLYTYPELDDYGPRSDVDYAGNYQPGRGQAPVWPALPGKKLFAYLEVTQRTPLVLKVLAETGEPTLVYMAHVPEGLKTLYADSNVKIVDQPLDLKSVAAQCDAGITHGGLIVVSTLLAAGKPQLSLPLFFPERITADKVVGLGAGLRCSLKLEELRDAIAQLLEDMSLAQASRAYAAKVAHMDMAWLTRRTLAPIQALAEAGSRT
jgi:UDP:flavonoid glycosyltransferase YjiC (YdhE family)